MRKIILAVFLILLIASPLWALSSAIQAVVSAGGATACAASFFEDAFTAENTTDTDHGVWTDETDTGGLLALVSNAAVFTFTATTAAYVYKTLGAPQTEGWIQWTIKWSDISMGGSGKNFYTFTVYDGEDLSFCVYFITDSGGDIHDIIARYRNDSSSIVTVGQVASGVADNTTYTIKIYYKRATDVDTSDGVIDVYIDGSRVINGTGLDWYTYADSQTARLGNYGTSAVTNTTGGITVTYDNFEWRADDCF